MVAWPQRLPFIMLVMFHLSRNADRIDRWLRPFNPNTWKVFHVAYFAVLPERSPPMNLFASLSGEWSDNRPKQQISPFLSSLLQEHRRRSLAVCIPRPPPHRRQSSARHPISSPWCQRRALTSVDRPKKRRSDEFSKDWRAHGGNWSVVLIAVARNIFVPGYDSSSSTPDAKDLGNLISISEAIDALKILSL
jgi:hypothetical protein